MPPTWVSYWFATPSLSLALMATTARPGSRGCWDVSGEPSSATQEWSATETTKRRPLEPSVRVVPRLSSLDDLVTKFLHLIGRDQVLKSKSPTREKSSAVTTMIDETTSSTIQFNFTRMAGHRFPSQPEGRRKPPYQSRNFLRNLL